MSISGKMDIAANTATILVAALLSAVLIRVYLLPRTPPQTASTIQAATQPQLPPQVKVGDSLKAGLPDVDWQKNRRTLILAISTQCHFCRDSAPFFRTLTEHAGDVKVVAVLPQPVGAAKKFLQGEGVHVEKVEQLALGRIGVIGTPTMILADSNGVVRKVWVGEVQPAQQQSVLTALGGSASM